MALKVYVDGNSGTTGLRIEKRLSGYANIQLLSLPEEYRKDKNAKRDIYAKADAVFLCLPDDAAREAVALVNTLPELKRPKLLDTSTAHRTKFAWVYGFPELSIKQRRRIEASDFVAVPGCHASGYIALVRPLVEAQILEPTLPLTCFSLTGYSGGGKKMIAEYEDENRPAEYAAPRIYALNQMHKHLAEMTTFSHNITAPVFCPTVGDFYSGMCVTIPLERHMLRKGGIREIQTLYKYAYHSDIVSYAENTADENGFLSAQSLSGKDNMLITVYGNKDRMLLTAVYDNLGKGASGAAVQCLNLMFGFSERTGLIL